MTNGKKVGFKYTKTIETNPDDSIYVVVKYENYFNGVAQNNAYLNDRENNYEYKTSDWDYVTMRKSDISLQKHIVSVKNGTETYNYERKNKKTTEMDDTEENQKNLYKTTHDKIEQAVDNNKEKYPVWIEAR